MLNKTQQKELLQIARKTLEGYITNGTAPRFSVTDPALKETRGVFVTVHRNGELRGCIGQIIGTDPLYLTVSRMAIESATGDPRFSPVTIKELPEIELEISVLSVPERIKDASEIELGKHGVIACRNHQSGVFLPQVAQETCWSKEEFLNELCQQKAYLPKDAWRDKDTELYTFTAQVFKEED